VFVLEVFIAPLYLLVPLVVATVIAADSFAGERERGTLEALLHTPTTDRELLTGKFLAAWLPAVTVAWAGFAVYSVLANVLMWPARERIFFPSRPGCCSRSG
jgi:ABC-2 type transport system permease protein